MNIREINDDTVITTGASSTFPNGKFRHGIGGVEAGDEGRRLDQGPMVPGPWAFTFGLSVSICSNPEMGSGADARRGREAGTEFLVETGDILTYKGEIYQVETFRHEEYVNLHRMDLRRNARDKASRSYKYGK